MALLPAVHKLAFRFPDYERYELASQIRRSSKSIVANIAEGFGRKRSVRDFKSYLSNALGSTNETIVHLKIAEALEYALNQEVQPLADAYTIVAKQLHRLMENWRDFSTTPTILNPSSHENNPASRIPLLDSNPQE
jgi:four helix bundle protein